MPNVFYSFTRDLYSKCVLCTAVANLTAYHLIFKTLMQVDLLPMLCLYMYQLYECIVNLNRSGESPFLLYFTETIQSWKGSYECH